MAGSTIENAPSGENTSPANTVKIPISGSQFSQIANLLKNYYSSPAQGDVLYRNASNVLGLAAGTTDKFLKTKGTGANPAWSEVSFYMQDAAPSSPVADDLWYETDTNLLWVYGTFAAASRWVSVNLYSMGSGQVPTSASAIIVPHVSTYAYNIYLDTFYLKYHVLTTNDGSNYWTVTLRKVTTTTAPASGAGSSIAALTTQSLTAGEWAEISTSINAVLDGTGSGLEFPFLDVVKTSAPGNMHYVAAATYRLIHP